MIFSLSLANSIALIKSRNFIISGETPRISSNFRTESKQKTLEKKKEVKSKIKEFQRFIKNNFDYVGENFSYEARSIHYGNKKSKKGIYGKA